MSKPMMYIDAFGWQMMGTWKFDDPYSPSETSEIVYRECPGYPPYVYAEWSDWCLEGESIWHPGLTCYREIPPEGQRYGQQCCYKGSLLVEASPDLVAPATGKDEEGRCIWGWGEIVGHTIVDWLPWILGFK